MKNNVKIFALTIATIIAFGSITFVSCNKEEHEYTQTGNAANCKSVESSPFDYIGELHNTALYYVGTELKDVFADFIKQSNMSTQEKDTLASYVLEQIPHIMTKYNLSTLPESEWESIIESISIHAGDDEIFSSDVANAILNVFSNFSNTSDLDVLKSEIRNYELSLVNSTMSTLDTQVAICLNIYTHSLDFWAEAIEDPENPWHELICTIDNGNVNLAKETGLRNWLHKAGQWIHNAYTTIKEKYTLKNIGLADMYGAILGIGPAAATGGNSIAISAIAMSAIAPLFM